jgi:hypothetical protein
VSHVWSWLVHQASPRQTGVEDKTRAARMIVHLSAPEKASDTVQQPHTG